jgi:hypothetical protein
MLNITNLICYFISFYTTWIFAIILLKFSINKEVQSFPLIFIFNLICELWDDFMSLYSRFYEVIIFESTYAIGEGKNYKVYL